MKKLNLASLGDHKSINIILFLSIKYKIEIPYHNHTTFYPDSEALKYLKKVIYANIIIYKFIVK